MSWFWGNKSSRATDDDGSDYFDDDASYESYYTDDDEYDEYDHVEEDFSTTDDHTDVTDGGTNPDAAATNVKDIPEAVPHKVSDDHNDDDSIADTECTKPDGKEVKVQLAGAEDISAANGGADNASILPGQNPVSTDGKQAKNDGKTTANSHPSLARAEADHGKKVTSKNDAVSHARNDDYDRSEHDETVSTHDDFRANQLNDAEVKSDAVDGTQWLPKLNSTDSSSGMPGKIAAEDTKHSDDDDINFDIDSDYESQEEDEKTTFAEKQSLLILAAEHDRVDILNSILSDDITDGDRAELLKPTLNIPPLHVAISYGSVNATQSLLRMGANPSIRPNVKQIQAAQQQHQNLQSGEKETELVQISNMNRFDCVSAWELAFGRGDYHSIPSDKKSWSLFGSKRKTRVTNDPTCDVDPDSRPIRPIDIPSAKRDGIKHAFTAEALRCVGADEVHRLQQLLESGMPSTIEIGGRSLVNWAKELGANQCREYLNSGVYVGTKSGEHARSDDTTLVGSVHSAADSKSSAAVSKVQKDSTVADSTNNNGQDAHVPSLLSEAAEKPMTIQNLANRCDELESLAEALTVCLDNLAEELSVCQSLLLQGGGSALAVHVKALRSTKDGKMEELNRVTAEYAENESDLVFLLEEAQELGLDIDRLFMHDWSPMPGHKPSSRYNSLMAQISSLDESKQRERLNEYIAASENKVNKLRASIADLSEESAKELEKVERRGLIGGIDLVRSIREVIRDIEFQLSETKMWNLECQAKIDVVQSQLEDEGLEHMSSGSLTSNGDNGQYEKDDESEISHGQSTSDGDISCEPVSLSEPPSDSVASSQPQQDRDLVLGDDDVAPQMPPVSVKPSPAYSAPKKNSIPGRIVNPIHSPRATTSENAFRQAGLVSTETLPPASPLHTPSEEIVSGESRAIVVRYD